MKFIGTHVIVMYFPNKSTHDRNRSFRCPQIMNANHICYAFFRCFDLKRGLNWLKLMDINWAPILLSIIVHAEDMVECIPLLIYDCKCVNQSWCQKQLQAPNLLYWLVKNKDFGSHDQLIAYFCRVARLSGRHSCWFGWEVFTCWLCWLLDSQTKHWISLAMEQS